MKKRKDLKVHIKNATRGLPPEQVKEDIEELKKVADLIDVDTSFPYRDFDEY